MTYRNRGGPPKHHIGPNRESWVRIFGSELVLYIDDTVQEDEPDGDLPEIKMSISAGTGRAKILRLTNLTRRELDVLREFLNRAIDKAEPIVDELDRRAEEAWKEGDDSYSRQYRAIPELVVREQRERPHDSGL